MLQVELAPDVEERLNLAAETRGLTPQAYASEIIDGAVSRLTVDAAIQRLTAPKRLTKEQMEEFFRKMAALGEGLPPLSEYALTRESFYEEHD
jgi:hypothetical protein